MVMAAAQPNITRVEYFFNTDPGFGNGTAVSVSPATNISNQAFTTDISSLPLGLNFLYLRSMDGNGKWSITNQLIFVKSATPPAAVNINKAEYFIDIDPGFGNANNISIASPSTNISALVFEANLATLIEGLHFLYLRSRNTNGQWSLTNQLSFVRFSVFGTAPLVTKCEYFIDTDPGLGQGSNISISPATNLTDVTVPVNLNNTAPGLHVLFVRSADANGKWSITNRFLFYKSVPVSIPANIVRAETFIDVDPGFGNAVPISVNAASNIADFAYPLNITGLSAGKHSMYIRSMDANGQWSITARDSFDISTPAPAPYININSITGTAFCGNSSFQLSFHATGTYNAGNVFSVQLSDAAGSFSNPTTIGSKNASTSASITCTLPQKLGNGNNYRLRVVSSDPQFTGATADSLMVINDQPQFNDTTVYVVCQQETINLTTVYNTGSFLTTWNTATPAAAPMGVYRLIATNAGILQCKDTSFTTVQQEVATWLGTSNSNWHHAANWSTGRIPTLVTHVIIPTGTPFQCIVNAQDAEAASMQVRTGATVSVAAGRKVYLLANCNPLPGN